jgi:hypothetical protein
MLPHLRHLVLGDEVRRQDAGRVARVNAGVLDVLHDAADDAAAAVRDRIHIGLERILEEPVDQHRVLRRHPRRAGEVRAERRLIVDDLHRAPAEDVGRAHQHRVVHPGGHPHRLLNREGDAARRLADAQLAREGLEAPTVLREVDRLGRRPQDPHPLALEPPGQPERRLSAQLHDDADRLLQVHDLEHVLEGQRLEVEGVRDVEVGGDGLGVGVHHDGAVPHFPEGERRADTAVVELDALPDPVGAAAEDHHRVAAARHGLVLLVVRRVEIRGR